MSPRLSRHDIKRNEIGEAVAHGIEYAEHHVRMLVWSLVGALALGLLGLGIHFFLKARNEKANDQLLTALRVYGAQVVVTGALPDDPKEPTFASESARRLRAKELFEKLADDYGRTAVGGAADLYLGEIALQEGNPESALERWQRFIDRHPSHALAAGARLNLWRLDREQGRGEQVAAELRTLLESPEKPMPGDLLLHELAVTLEALGQKEEAAATHQRLADEYPQSPYRKAPAPGAPPAALRGI